ncbi:MAG: glycoside hydrolase family 5 protein [Cellvibrionaceae bacterium]|nr:glycoside hydrolase family 5 protein [Cellvibrionaceae bacterium]
MLETDGTLAKGQGQYIGSVSTPGSAVFSWNNEIKATISSVTSMDWHVQLIHAISVTQGQQYSICFSAKGEASRTIGVNIDQGGTPGYDSVITEGAYNPVLSTTYQAHKHTFTASVTDTSARLTFNLGLSDVDVFLDDIGVYPGAQCGNPAKTPTGSVGSGSDNIVGTPAITTRGNQVLFGGQPGSIAGMSLFWSSFVEDGGKFYTPGVVQTLKRDWNARLVRAAMGVDTADGYLTDPTNNVNRVKTIVDAAIANDMYVIIDWHSHNAEDQKPQAIAFFQEMARTYGNRNNVIYEIYNEPDCPTSATICGWDNKTSWATIKAYAVDVIAAIRAIDPDNLIIVGTPFYSQFVDEASEDPIAGVNIAYTLHFYAASHKEQERARARTALRNGIPLFVTEWGTVSASGDGAMDVAESDAWMEFLYDNNISHANWSVSDKLEGASILKPGTNGENGGWSDGDLTPSGQYVKSQIMMW